MTSLVWIYLLPYCFTTLAIAGSFRWKPEGWAWAWLYLIATSAAFRFLLWAVPGAAPWASGILILALFFLGLHHGWRWRAAFRLRPAAWPFAALAAVVMARSAFPNFDVDSLSYHLAAIRWLQAKAALPDLQAHARGVYLAYRFVGFEEFLGIPGLVGNLPLWAGLIGGWCKVLALCSVLSVIPAGAPFLRYAAAYLLLIDDHFLFSGQNRFVYLHPALIGLVVLAFWELWRALRGKPGSLALAAGLFLGIAYDKYHGLFFLVLGGVGVVGALLLPSARRALSFPRLWSALRSLPVAIGAFGCLAMYGLNWVEEGTPVYPYLSGAFVRGMDATYFGGGLLAHLLEDKYKLFTYPGNLALKFFVLLAPLALAAWLAGDRRVNRRTLSLALWGFAITFGWVLLCNVINYETSRGHGRYPRFVYALTICALGALGAAVAKRQRWLRAPKLRLAQHVAGLALLAWLVATLDTRYFNVTPSQRVGWAGIRDYWADPAPFDVHVPTRAELAASDDFPRVDGPALRECLLKLRPADVSEHGILDGERVIVVDDHLNWPDSALAGFALRPTMNPGLRPAFGEYRLLVVDKTYLKALPADIAQDPALVELKARWEKASPACETPSLALFRI